MDCGYRIVAALPGTVKVKFHVQRLAQELLVNGEYIEAVLLYRDCLGGIHEYDPLFMYGLAQAEFGLGNCTIVKELK
ncbi:hypothetical protein [Cellvibrio mixtus]|uniref:hypothetical protein n=1 Tax=Cellvibrio mixtus TaxID=39650 RepID=UPI000586F04D|nr:hypothetical protein [Cellvibrio mixtus]